MQFSCNAQFNDGEEVETHRRNGIAVGRCTELPFQTVVGLLVEVKVGTHDGETDRIARGNGDGVVAI